MTFRQQFQNTYTHTSIKDDPSEQGKIILTDDAYAQTDALHLLIDMIDKLRFS